MKMVGSRREALGLSMTALATAVVGGSSVLGEAASAAVTIPKGPLNGTYKVIDFRNRPPLDEFKNLYAFASSPRLAARPRSAANSPTVKTLGTPIFNTTNAMDIWQKEIKSAGIDAVVTLGRYVPGDPIWGSTTYETILKLQRDYPGKVWGFGHVNLEQDMNITLGEVESAIKAGLRGFNLEPGHRKNRGGPTFINDPVFYPLFDLLIGYNIPLMTHTGPLAGPTFAWSNNMLHYDEVCKKFRKLNFVLGHAAFPYAMEAHACAIVNPNLYLSPDTLAFGPGGEIYQKGIAYLPDQYIFGTAFPSDDLAADIALTLEYPLSKSAMENYLYNNAAKLLKI